MSGGPPPREGDAPVERSSVTDGTGGSNARFEMAYSPPAGERLAFGPPWRVKLPAYLYLVFAIAVAATAAAGYRSTPTSRLYAWVVQGDRGRPMTAAGLSLLLFVSAIATVARTHMRGVIVNADGLEARYLLPLGIPRVRKWAWAQIFRLDLGGTTPGMELWDGSYERLPEVAETDRLVHLLLGIATAHHIRVTRTATPPRSNTGRATDDHADEDDGAA
jgi:hypothetical protein